MLLFYISVFEYIYGRMNGIKAIRFAKTVRKRADLTEKKYKEDLSGLGTFGKMKAEDLTTEVEEIIEDRMFTAKLLRETARDISKKHPWFADILETEAKRQRNKCSVLRGRGTG